MRREYITTAAINAAPAAVWAILTDAAAYAQWNPEIIGVQGRFGPGERIKASVKVKAGNKMAVRDLPLRITAFTPPTPQYSRGSMEWTGGLPLGLFTGKRTLSVAPRGNRGCEFRMELRMRGPLAAMILKSVGDRQPEIDSFSVALKARAEAS
jgi:hypothetical protein